MPFGLPPPSSALIFYSDSIAADPPKNEKDGAPQVATDDVLKKLRELGAVVRSSDIGKVDSDNVNIKLREGWNGKPDDFKLLSRVLNLDWLEVIGVPITDDDLRQLDGLKHLARVYLYGTKVTTAGAELLTKMHPGIEIDRRGSAQLGIAGDTDPAGVKINVVLARSAADKAGLLAGDVITTLDGKDVGDYQRLQKRIGAHEAGDNVTIELRRGDETLKKEVTLGSWR